MLISLSYTHTSNHIRVPRWELYTLFDRLIITFFIYFVCLSFPVVTLNFEVCIESVFSRALSRRICLVLCVYRTNHSDWVCSMVWYAVLVQRFTIRWTLNNYTPQPLIIIIIRIYLMAPHSKKACRVVVTFCRCLKLIAEQSKWFVDARKRWIVININPTSYVYLWPMRQKRVVIQRE